MKYYFVEYQRPEDAEAGYQIVELDEGETLEKEIEERLEAIRCYVAYIFSDSVQETLAEEFEQRSDYQQKASDLRELHDLFEYEGYLLLDRGFRSRLYAKLLRMTPADYSPPDPALLCRMRNYRSEDEVLYSPPEMQDLITHAIQRGMAKFMREWKQVVPWN